MEIHHGMREVIIPTSYHSCCTTFKIGTLGNLLKFGELIAGTVCLLLVTKYNIWNMLMQNGPESSEIPQLKKLFGGFTGGAEAALMFIVSFAFLAMTFFLLISYLFSTITAAMLPKTVLESVYHFWAFVFYFSASLALLIKVRDLKQNGLYELFQNSDGSRDDVRRNNIAIFFDSNLAAGWSGLVNSFLYLLSTICSVRLYRAG